MNSPRYRVALTLLLALLLASTSAAATTAESVTVTILSSNLANEVTVGEWGFSALVEVDGR